MTIRNEKGLKLRAQMQWVRRLVFGGLVPLLMLVLTVVVCWRAESSDPVLIVLGIMWGMLIWVRHEISETDIRDRQRTVIAMSYLDCKIEHKCMDNGNCSECRKAVINVAAEDGYPVQW